MWRIELYSFYMMSVFEKNALNIADTGKTSQVTLFNPDYKSMENVPIIDRAIVYDCSYSKNSYVLLIHNALHVPSMKYNLVQPFIIR